MTIQQCLSLFTKEEVLDGDEKPVSALRRIIRLIVRQVGIRCAYRDKVVQVQIWEEEQDRMEC